jgi:hypothetical protein
MVPFPAKLRIVDPWDRSVASVGDESQGHSEIFVRFWRPSGPIIHSNCTISFVISDPSAVNQD